MTTASVHPVVALPAFGAPCDETEAAALVREAAARGARLRVVGRGDWLDAGHPVHPDAALHLAAMRGVVEYVPGDLTLTARAGTTLDEIARVTRAERQLLALDPHGGDSCTLGATVATASAGPLAHAFGGPRDNVLGVAFVTGSGDVVRAGGRVVKNVAGFDLARLVTGAWGTLGIVTEVSVRLRSLPEAEATVAVALPSGAQALAPWMARVRGTPLHAWALELVNGPLAAHLALGERPLLLARLAGNAPLVSAQRALLSALGDVADVPGDVWSRLRTCEPRDAAVARLSTRPARLAELCAELFSPATRAFGLLAHASVGRGIVRFVLPGAEGFGIPRTSGRWVAVDAPPPRRIVERLPSALWATLGREWTTPRANDVLSRRVRDAFDPHRLLNPGILGEDAAPSVVSA